MGFKKISIVMPAYNEEKTIANIIGKMVDVDFGMLKKELIVINDCSKDDTQRIVESLITKLNNELVEIKLLNNPQNLGKSQSVRKGIVESTGDLVVIQDADLEYDPEDLKEFVNIFQLDEKIEVVYGNRFGKDNKVIYWQNWIGNRFLTFVSNIFTGVRGFRVSDMEVCYKMVKGDLMREVGASIVSKSVFGFEPEITAKLAKKKVKYTQVPINYYPRTVAEGKHMKAWKDGAKALVEIVKFNLSYNLGSFKSIKPKLWLNS